VHRRWAGDLDVVGESVSDELIRSTAALRIFGDDLDLDEISQIIGHEPTNAWR
jgi:hypothetical protein